MTDYNTLSPEELSALHKKRMEEAQSIMNKIVTDPSEISVKDLTKAVDYFNVVAENDRRSNDPT
jgi:hypothetical protein